MSGSETGMMTSREPFSSGVQKSPVQQQPLMQNMRLAFGSDGAAIYKPIVAISPPTYQSSGGGMGENSVNAVATGTGGSAMMTQGVNMNMSSSEPMSKKKRGRPRKYGPDSNMALAALPSPPVNPLQSGGGFSPPPSVTTATVATAGSASPNSSKKARGRPLGSRKKQRAEAFGSTGLGFLPHVITVKAGEDVSAKIISFSQHGPRAVCVLSANGAISNVTLRQPATSGGTVTYEGKFEILSLSGSFLLVENGGQRSRTGGLSVSLSGPDGRVLGGGVAGLLTAATPVQVVVGSFVSDSRKESNLPNHIESLSTQPTVAPVSGPTVPSSPPSHGTLSESSDGPGSPLNQSMGACNSIPPGMTNIQWK